MTRYWIGSSLEKAVWYFTSDGQVYQKLDSGLTAGDLEAHKGPKGTYKLNGNMLEVTWSDGRTSKSRFEPDKGGTAFGWDAGLFTPVTPITDNKMVVGKFEGGEFISHNDSGISVSNTYEFRSDGTYTRFGISSVKSTTKESVLTGGSQGTSTGTWKAESYSLTLTGSDGSVTRKIAFPWTDNDKATLPTHLFFGGLLMKRQ